MSFRQAYKASFALLFGIVLSLLLAELILRFVPAFDFVQRGDRLSLPKNKKMVLRNEQIPELDSVIVHTKNSLGFRGPGMPENFEEYLSIVAVGGSTTECKFLSDGEDWPAVLQDLLSSNYNDIWVNNAGFDGHSTYGHELLLEQYLVDLKPDIVLFLVGRNDMLRDDLTSSKGIIADLNHWLIENFAVAAVISNIHGIWMAQRENFTHFSLEKMDVQYLDIPESKMNAQLEHFSESYISAYKARIELLIQTCRKNEIEPVFITQAALPGFGIDSVTGIDLARVKITDRLNGELFWKTLQLYNITLKETAANENCQVIDLANELSKNGVYYYDFIHFTDLGAEKAAEIIFSKLNLKVRYNSNLDVPED